MKMTLTEIANHIDGTLLGADLTISSVGIDTRTMKAGDLYIAIKGANFDGHDFIEQAQQAGAVAAVVSREAKTEMPIITA